MQASKFWRAIAVIACAGIFYVGHGLHNPAGHWMPSLVNSARAGGVAVDPIRADSSRTATRIYTSNESGTILYVWEAPATGEAAPRHMLTAAIPKDKWLPATPGSPERK